MLDKSIEFLKGISVILLYNVVIPFVFGILFGRFMLNTYSVPYQICYIALYLVIIAVFIFLYRESLIKEWKDFKANKNDYFHKMIRYWLIGFILMYFFNRIVFQITGGIAANQEANNTILEAAPVLAVSIMVFLGPFIEEIAFRKSFKKAFTNKYVFATVTALLFGGAHLLASFDTFSVAAILENWTSLLHIFPYGSLGFMFGLLYYETDNIFCSTFAHMIHNGIAVLLLIVSTFIF